MAVRDDFTAGEVLAAADLNDTFALKLPFAYGTATPSTTVEGFVWFDENDTPPTPKFWDGAAFATLAPAPGLELITATSVGSAVSSITLNGVFSSAYDAYKITLTGGAGSAQSNLRLQYGASTVNYYDAVFFVANTNVTSPQSAGTNNGSIHARCGSTDSDGHQVSIDVVNPFLAKQTTFHGLYGFGPSAYGVCSGFHDVASSFADFTISTFSGTMTGGTLRVYGYRN